MKKNNRMWVYLLVFGLLLNISMSFVPSGSGEPNDSVAYHYWYAPENSFGIQEMKTVNWSYFKQLFLAHITWMLEYKRYESSEWTDGLDYLTIERTWNESGFWKFNLILDVPVDIYSARFTFGIDLPCLQYVERSGYEVWINYTANATETYSCMFNWSDIASIPGLVITKGIQDGIFWFRFRRDDIPAGHYEFDPVFGNTGTDVASFGTFDNYQYGSFFLLGNGADSVEADNITIHLRVPVDNTYVGDVSCGIYEYVDYSSSYAGELIGQTEVKEIDVTGNTIWFETFDFVSNPTLSNGTTYYLSAIAEEGDPNALYLYRDADPDIAIYETGAPVDPMQDPWVGESTSGVSYHIYCSFTNISDNNAPTFSGYHPSPNGTTDISLEPRINVIVTDIEDSPDCNWYTSTNSVDWTWRQKNSSVATTTNISYDFTQASSYNAIYYWKVTADDGTVNVTSSHYHFTTVADTTIPVQGSNATNNLTITWNVTISDDSGSFNWTIECNGQSNSSNGDSNGNKNIVLFNLLENTTYTVFVNVTDVSGNWNNQTYTFIIGNTSGVGSSTIIIVPMSGGANLAMSLPIGGLMGALFAMVFVRRSRRRE